MGQKDEPGTATGKSNEAVAGSLRPLVQEDVPGSTITLYENRKKSRHAKRCFFTHASFA